MGDGSSDLGEPWTVPSRRDLWTLGGHDHVSPFYYHPGPHPHQHSYSSPVTVPSDYIPSDRSYLVPGIALSLPGGTPSRVSVFPGQRR